jgi:cytochrome c-type biogenesis protein CcmE
MSTGAKIGVTIAIVVGGIGYMIFTTVSSGEALEYYKHVQEVMKEPAAWQGKRLQLHGNVVQGTVVKKPGSLDFRFGLHRGGEWIDVAYSGLMPDSFKDCGEAVVKGKLSGNRTFTAESISAKCPSKYDGKRQTGVCGEQFRAAVLAHRRSATGKNVAGR